MLFLRCNIIALCFLNGFPVWAQSLATGEAYRPPLIRILVGLLLCIFLAYAVVLVLKNIQRRNSGMSGLSGLRKLTKASGGNEVVVLETHRLNTTSDVCLIAYNDTKFLIVLSPDGAHVLDQTGARTFEDRLNKAKPK